MKQFNAILTGSTKYGERSPKSDIDVAIWVSSQTLDQLWTDHEDKKRIVYNQVKFIEDTTHPFVIGFEHDDSGGVDIHCRMSEDDLDTLAGLHYHERGADRCWRSTRRNNDVNIIPVCDPDRWSIWEEGTAALYESRLTGDAPPTRQEAIDFFTLLGMPRINSGDE